MPCDCSLNGEGILPTQQLVCQACRADRLTPCTVCVVESSIELEVAAECAIKTLFVVVHPAVDQLDDVGSVG